MHRTVENSTDELRETLRANKRLRVELRELADSAREHSRFCLDQLHPLARKEAVAFDWWLYTDSPEKA